MAVKFKDLVYVRPSEKKVLEAIENETKNLKQAENWEKVKATFERFHVKTRYLVREKTMPLS